MFNSNGIPSYISAVIKQETEKDSSRNHDVALVGLEIGRKSKVFNAIAGEILKEISNLLFINDNRQPIKHQVVHTASFIIIVSNINDYVSYFKQRWRWNLFWQLKRFFWSMIDIFSFKPWLDSTKFFSVSTNFQPLKLKTVLFLFDYIGALNVVVPHQDKRLHVFAANRFISRE